MISSKKLFNLLQRLPQLHRDHSNLFLDTLNNKNTEPWIEFLKRNLQISFSMLASKSRFKAKNVVFFYSLFSNSFLAHKNIYNLSISHKKVFSYTMLKSLAIEASKINLQGNCLVINRLVISRLTLLLVWALLGNITSILYYIWFSTDTCFTPSKLLMLEKLLRKSVF